MDNPFSKPIARFALRYLSSLLRLESHNQEVPLHAKHQAPLRPLAKSPELSCTGCKSSLGTRRPVINRTHHSRCVPDITSVSPRSRVFNISGSTRQQKVARSHKSLTAPLPYNDFQSLDTIRLEDGNARKMILKCSMFSRFFLRFYEPVVYAWHVPKDRILPDYCLSNAIHGIGQI